MKAKIQIKYFTNPGINGHRDEGHPDHEINPSKSTLKNLFENYLPERRQELTRSYGNIGFTGIGIFVEAENGDSFSFSANSGVDDINEHPLKHLSYEQLLEVETDHRKQIHIYDEERRLLPEFCRSRNLSSRHRHEETGEIIPLAVTITDSCELPEKFWIEWQEYFKTNIKPFKFE